MSTTSTKMRRALFKRENTITLSLVESQNNISQLLAKLDDTHSGNGEKDFAYVQANISDLLGKFEDSHTHMEGDLTDILESFQKGTMSPEEISGLLRSEKERGSMSLRIVEEMQERLDEVLSFVAHFVSDVEDGRPLPKESFKALFEELDSVAESAHTMEKVVRTPVRKVREVKGKIQLERQQSAEHARGIGKKLADMMATRRGGTNAPERFVRAEAPPKKPVRADRDRQSTSVSMERDKAVIDRRAVSPTARAARPTSSSFRALSRQSSLESERLDSDDDQELELKGKKSNFTVKRIMRQASGQQTIRSALVRSLTNEMDDDELSFDSSADGGMGHFQKVKVSKSHRQTQTDELITMLRWDSVAVQPGQTTTGNAKNASSREARESNLPEAMRKQIADRRASEANSHSPERNVSFSVQGGEAELASSEHVHHKSSLGVLKNHGEPLPTHQEEKKGASKKKSKASSASSDTPSSVSVESSESSVTGGNKQAKGKSVTQKKNEPKRKTSSSGLPAESKTVSTTNAVSSPSSKPVGNSFNFSIRTSAEAEEDKKALDAEKEAAERTDPEGRDSYLDMKENRLKKLEALLNNKTENFELLCESRIREKMLAFEKKVRDEVAAGTWKPSLLREESTQDASSSGESQDKAKTSDGSKGGDDESPSAKDATLAAATATPGAPGTATANTEKEKMTDDLGSETSSCARTGFGKKDTTTAQNRGNEQNDMKKILQTLLLFLPTQQSMDTAARGIQKYNTLNGGISDSGGNPGDGHGSSDQSAGQTQNSTVPSNGEALGALNGETNGMPDSTLKLPRVAGSSSRPTTSEARGGSRPASKGGPRSARGESQGGNLKMGSSVGKYDTVSDADALSINFDAYAGERRPQSSHQREMQERLRNYDMESGLGEIWVPPPTGLARKKMPNTVVIFPLHTMDHATSTDDLVSDDLPPSPRGDGGLGEEMSKSIAMESSAGDVPVAGVDDVAMATTPAKDTPMKNPADSNSREATSRVPRADFALQSIQNELTVSTNPLSTLYHYFFPYLSVLSRHHLMAAASGVSCNQSGEVDPSAVATKAVPTYSTRSLAGLFEVVYEEVSKLEHTSYHALEALYSCDEMMTNLIIMANSHQELDEQFYVALGEASRQLGEIEIAEAWTDMLLTNSRTIFTRVRALSIDPKTIGEKYEVAHKAFLNCQGTNVALKQQLAILKKKVNSHLRQPMYVVQHNPHGGDKDLLRKVNKMSKRCEDLEESLGDAQDELEELRAQIIEMDRSRDTTPAALWFFSALHNPRLPDVVGNHLQQLLSVKGVIDGKEHFDFLVLKRRLESCFLGLPAIQQFFKRFIGMQKKYTQSRTKMFLDRKLVGGDADGYFVCPMCNTDCRQPSTTLPEPPRTANTAKKMTSSKKGIGRTPGGISGSPALILPGSRDGLGSSFGR